MQTISCVLSLLDILQEVEKVQMLLGQVEICGFGAYRYFRIEDLGWLQPLCSFVCSGLLFGWTRCYIHSCCSNYIAPSEINASLTVVRRE